MYISDQGTHSGESRVHREARPVSSSRYTGGVQAPLYPADRARLTRAQSGGFMDRKDDGEPGIKTIWQGLRQVMTAVETLRELLRQAA